MKKTRHRNKPRNEPRNEHGYALVGIMSVMMFALILTTAAAPKIKLESQREKEEEMLWRGQQISRGLANYQKARGSFPTDLADLVKGIEVGTKKMRFLRASALCDPMMPCTPGTPNWRSVYPGDPLVKELLDAYIATRERGTAVLPPPPATLVQYAAMGATRLPSGLGGGSGLGPYQPTGGSDVSSNNGNNQSGGGQGESQLGDKLKGPIIGVVSRKDDRMFRNYYGIEEYDKTLFFPGVNVMVSGFLNPLVLGSALASGSGPDPNCPKGGVYIDGKCWGNLVGGQCPPDQRESGKCTPQ